MIGHLRLPSNKSLVMYTPVQFFFSQTNPPVLWLSTVQAFDFRSRQHDAKWAKWAETWAKLIEGSLEVKLPIIWTDEKQRWEESAKRREEERESLRKKI
jgi:hypothetical protein